MHVQTKRWSVLAMAVAATLPATSANAGKIYWVQSFEDRIQRANLDGTASGILLQSPVIFDPIAIAVDPAGGKFYFIQSFDDSVLRADLNGANLQVVLAPPQVLNPVAIAVDSVGGKVYCAQSSDDTIVRANLNGTAVETVVAPPTSLNLKALAVDSTAGKIYWAENPANDIRRADLNGGNPETVADAIFVSDAVSLAVDPGNAQVYWAERSGNRIRRADANGFNSNVITFLDAVFVSDPVSIALDLANGRIYWVEAAGSRIRRADLTGANVTTVLEPPLLFDPLAIAVDSTPTGCQPPNCNDGNACTNDACVNGTCTHTPVACDTGLFCSAKVCDPLLGCVFDGKCIPNNTNGNPCPNPATCDENTNTCGGCKQPTAVGISCRYLAVTPADQGSTPIALKVIGECHDTQSACVVQYVQSKCNGGANNGQNCLTDADCPKTCAGGLNPGAVCTTNGDCVLGTCAGKCEAGTLGSTPFYKTASQWGTAKVRGAQIRPGADYLVETQCDFPGVVLSAATSARTWKWGDIDGDGDVDALDVAQLVDAFKARVGGVPFEQANIWGCTPDKFIDALDITEDVDAFKGLAFPCGITCP
jgi:hypothetical protein